ncbi:MAG: ATP-binding protein [Lachnospiraceae bacterium]|nr:ATP-binding protein [Lachnospiraceae bacterium]
MLVSVRLNNCYIYDQEVEFSMRADMRQKRFSSNVVSGKNSNVVKTAMIIGPNNAGKTNLCRCIAGIKGILLNQGIGLGKNLFSPNAITEFEIVFIEKENEYSFTVKIDLSRSEFLYENLTQILYDKYKNKKETVMYIRDNISSEYVCADEKLSSLMRAMGRNNLLFYLLDTKQFAVLDEAKNVISSFASKIDIVDMNNIPIKKTIDMMKMTSEAKKRIVNFVLNADLSLEDFRYLSDEELRISFENKQNGEEIKPQENALVASAPILEMLHLSSVYHGISVPSILFDSTGTKKIAALAGYVIGALEDGRILIVDELDNSLHMRLTRAIIALFNNDLNNKAQMIFTAHDVTLLDCKKLFRKEQIWFAYKDFEGTYLYSLAEFTADKDGVRDTTDLIEKYKSGVFGALPEPDLFKSLQEVTESVKGSDNQQKT